MKQIILFLSTIVFLFIGQYSSGQSTLIKKQVDSLTYLGADAFKCSSVFWRIVAAKTLSIPYLINKISDTTTTAARDKCKTTNLKVGDLAYLALKEIIPLPFFAVTNMQCDMIDHGCQLGVFEYIELNRNKFKIQVQTWNINQFQKYKWTKYDRKELTDCYRQNKIYGRYYLDR